MELADLLRNLKLQTFIAFDFETTGLDPCNHKITEFAAVKFEEGKATDSFQTLINPERPIPIDVVRKTGISDEMVKGAPKAKEITEGVFEFIGDYPIVAHNLPFDLSFLAKMRDTHLSGEVDNEGYDTVPLAQALLFFLPNHQLGTIGEYLGIASDSTHRALADTEIVGTLFLELIREAASYSLTVIQRILAVSEGRDFHNKLLFDRLATELARRGDSGNGLLKSKIHKLCPSPIFNHKGNNLLPDFTPESFFGEDGLLEKTIGEGYETRDSQIRYCQMVRETISDGAVGVLEAGTGLGKSLAYLFAALERALGQPGEPVIISCHTKPLQDQLFQQELPKLADALDVTFSATIMKGRQNYICKTRVNQVIAEAKTLLSDKEVQSMIVILIWMQWTRSGDFEECTGFLKRRPYRLKAMIQSDPGFCTTRNCKSTAGCFLGPLRIATQNADIVVVNHSFLLYELENQSALPSLRTLILDEAHNLVKVGYNHFTVSLSQRMISDQFQPLTKSSNRGKRMKMMMDKLSAVDPNVNRHFTVLQNTVEILLSSSTRFFGKLTQEGSKRYSRRSRYIETNRVRELTDHYDHAVDELKSLNEAFIRAVNDISRLESVLSDVPDCQIDEEVRRTINRMSENIRVLAQTLERLTSDQSKEWVYWETGMFVRDKLELTLSAVPLDVGPNLREILFETAESSVATSATLSIGEEFYYFLRRFGLDPSDDKTLYFKTFPSPFYYEDQCSYFQWTGGIAPADDQFVPLICQTVNTLFSKYKKRMLVLFTSRTMLQDSYDRLMVSSLSSKAPILAQLSDASRSALIKQFRRSHNGILLGTSSFWEGIDLPGDLLEILMITRIPFDVPTDPVIQAYNDKIEEGGRNAFLDHSVPAAAIRLRQGFGRLIRSINDEGIFINLDNRVTTKRYGHVFQSIIPVRMKSFSDPDHLPT
ncbi:MAG: hypothetical protein CMG71_06520 [Candidatus Marinimicrobia bacterium]|nr:hypothetical protein [Candidatus Neomarinimicrobiota bacterium]